MRVLQTTDNCGPDASPEQQVLQFGGFVGGYQRARAKVAFIALELCDGVIYVVRRGQIEMAVAELFSHNGKVCAAASVDVDRKIR